MVTPPELSSVVRLAAQPQVSRIGKKEKEKERIRIAAMSFG